MTVPASTPAAASPEALDAARPSDTIARTAALAVLFAAPALMCVHGGVVADSDVWWHLRTGQWMAEHHAVLRVDVFSASSSGKPYAPYSWLYELLIYGLVHKLGLFGILAYSSAVVAAITVAVWHLVKRLQTDFFIVATLTFAACYCLRHLYTPRPWLFSILFFVLELDILMYARKTGRVRELAWLPVIFALWSNVHIQFVDGLLVLLLALAEAVMSGWGIGVRTRLRASWLGAACAASLLATLVNPFGLHIYRVACDLATQPRVFDWIAELQALSFRDASQFLLLFLALAAAAALGWDRRFRIFEISLFLFAAFVSFRSERDVWVMAMAATAILASVIHRRESPVPQLARFTTVAASITASVGMLVGFRTMYPNATPLENEIAGHLPERAVDEIKAEGYAGPVYDDYNWGGYLIWALRMPVSIDGRASFYGDDKIARSAKTWAGQSDWASDPDLKSAGIVIGPNQAALTQLLRTDPLYSLVYEDNLAAVFVARK